VRVVNNRFDCVVKHCIAVLYWHMIAEQSYEVGIGNPPERHWIDVSNHEMCIKWLKSTEKNAYLVKTWTVAEETLQQSVK
jgi:hypothetical protein